MKKYIVYPLFALFLSFFSLPHVKAMYRSWEKKPQVQVPSEERETLHEIITSHENRLEELVEIIQKIKEALPQEANKINQIIQSVEKVPQTTSSPEEQGRVIMNIPTLQSQLFPQQPESPSEEKYEGEQEYFQQSHVEEEYQRALAESRRLEDERRRKEEEEEYQRQLQKTLWQSTIESYPPTKEEETEGEEEYEGEEGDFQELRKLEDERRRREEEDFQRAQEESQRLEAERRRKEEEKARKWKQQRDEELERVIENMRKMKQSFQPQQQPKSLLSKKEETEGEEEYEGEEELRRKQKYERKRKPYVTPLPVFRKRFEKKRTLKKTKTPINILIANKPPEYFIPKLKEELETLDVSSNITVAERYEGYFVDPSDEEKLKKHPCDVCLFIDNSSNLTPMPNEEYLKNWLTSLANITTTRSVIHIFFSNKFEGYLNRYARKFKSYSNLCRYLSGIFLQKFGKEHPGADEQYDDFWFTKKNPETEEEGKHRRKEMKDLANLIKKVADYLNKQK